MKDSILICNICEAVDTWISDGDCDGCNDCGSIEQGFSEYHVYKKDPTLLIDDAGILYDGDFNVVGSDQ